MKKILALLLILLAKTSIGSDGCTFSVYCRPIGTTQYPTSGSLHCINGLNHDPNQQWSTGHLSTPLAYCDGDWVELAYNPTDGCSQQQSWTCVTVQCYKFPQTFNSANISAPTGYYSFVIFLHTNCGETSCTPSGSAIGDDPCQGGGQ